MADKETKTKTSDEICAQTEDNLRRLLSDLAQTSTPQKRAALWAQISHEKHVVAKMKNKAGILYLSIFLSSSDMDGIFAEMIDADYSEFPFVLAFSDYDSAAYKSAREYGMKECDYDEESLEKRVRDEKDDVLYNFLQNYVKFVEFEGPDGEKEREKRLNLVGTILEDGEYTWFKSYSYWTDLMNQ